MLETESESECGLIQRKWPCA